MALDYLIYEDAIRRPETQSVFESVIAQINDGTARVHQLSRSCGFRVGKQGVLGTAVLEFFLARQIAEGFSADAAQAFTEKVRLLLGWDAISYTLKAHWFEPIVRNPFLHDERHDASGPEWLSKKKWSLKPDADLRQVNPEWLRFACWIAVCFMKYGASFESISADEIFAQVTLLGSDLPARLRNEGSGQLSADVISYKDTAVSCVANDVFATIKITMKVESEANYRIVLAWLCRLLEANFPPSYGIEFRSPVKKYLPLKGLPKKGVHQLFANAVSYPGLRPLIEQYARLAMREYHWYTNVDEENPAMPGTFAVFALALADDAYVPLALQYLCICDGEHQSIHAELIHAYIAAHGFTANAIALLAACAGNIQQLDPIRTYPALIANRESLAALGRARTAAAELAPSGIAQLNGNVNRGRRARDPAWDAVVYAIWGDEGMRHPETLIAQAPDDLKPLYEAVLH